MSFDEQPDGDPHGECAEEIKMLERKLAAMTAERDELKSSHGYACKLVATMHEAAVGEIRGPSLGVVEDVRALREERDAALIKLDQLCIQARPDIAPGWTALPSVEWCAIMDLSQ